MASSKKEDQTIWLLGYYKIKDNSMANADADRITEGNEKFKKTKKIKSA